ncbi:MAG: hypothetical protein JNK65_06110 [Deltaproteobacteria bacterium]|nr:hypothetical protein [Deltaproteobacteria bacterium]
MFFLLIGWVLLPYYSSTAQSSISVVQVTGKDIPSFVGKEISKIQVQVFKQGKWQGIPYQIDEKAFDVISKSRRWVLDQAFSRRVDLPAGDQKLDPDEVILFMQKDMGEKASPENTVEHPVLEIKTSAGFAYLFYDPKTQLKSSVKYVSYDPERDAIDALGYKNAFNKDHAMVQEELIPKNVKSGTPTNILDRFKIRMLLALKNFFDVNIEEDNVTAKRIGYKEGPIRIIRRLTIYKSLGPVRITPKADSDFLMYPYFVQIPSRLDNPIDGRKALDPKSKGFAGFDFTKFFYGAKFYSEKNPTPVIIDGNMSPAEKALNLNDINWWVVSGNQGTMMVKVVWDPALKQAGVPCDLYYMDDRNSLKPPEQDPGESAVGFQIDFTKVPAGRYDIYVNQIFPPQSVEGSEKALFQEIVPPVISVKEAGEGPKLAELIK